jgi:hypothetical protein
MAVAVWLHDGGRGGSAAGSTTAGCTAGGAGSAAACVAAGGAGNAGSTAAGRAVAAAGSTGTTVARTGKMENEMVFPGRAVKSLYLRSPTAVIRAVGDNLISDGSLTVVGDRASCPTASPDART